MGASYGPADGVSPGSSPGYGNARMISSISCDNVSFFPILMSMQTEPGLPFRRLILVGI